MAVPVVLTAYAIGAGAIVMWVLARFPSLGPHSYAGVLAAMVISWLAMNVAPQLFDPLAELGRYGPAAAMMALILPALLAAFWTVASLLRLLAGLLPTGRRG